MLKTLQLNNRVIGMYLSDHGNIYFNGDNANRTAFITSEFSNYIPILDFIEINHRKEVTFGNGINKNDEIVTYNKAISGRSFSEAVIRNGNIEVSANDLFIGPITLFLNFSNYNLTVVNENEFRKTFVPIENDHLEDFKGKIVIMNIHTLNTPKSIQNITGCVNYLESLVDRFKNRNAPNIEEMKEVIKYAADKWSETKFFNALSQSNSLKIATMIEISETEFLRDKTNSLYLMNQELVITLDNIVQAADHPETTNAVLSNRDIHNDVRKNSFTCYIVDNEDKIADRYINIAGTVKKISKLKNHNLVNGLYMITVDAEGKTHNDIVCKLDELDSNKYVYRSIEEANIGADIKVQYKDSVEIAKTELESTKIDKMNESLELKALYELITKDQEVRKGEYLTELEKLRSEIKVNLEAIKSKEEKETLREKRHLERIKTEDEIRTTREKRDFESFRYDIDRRTHLIKSDYEESKYQRDSFVEGLKTVGAVAGVLATGFLIYSKVSSAK